MTPDFEKIAAFFADTEGPWRAPSYDLEQSPVAHLIRSTEIAGTTYYFCILHPGFKNMYWHVIEHHIKYTKGLDHYEAAKTSQ